ncbi:g6082 [Coccomyxa elongata]
MGQRRHAYRPGGSFNQLPFHAVTPGYILSSGILARQRLLFTTNMESHGTQCWQRTRRMSERIVKLERQLDRIRDWKAEEIQKGAARDIKLVAEYQASEDSLLGAVKCAQERKAFQDSLLEALKSTQARKVLAGTVIPGNPQLCAFWEELKTADFDEDDVLKLRDGVFFLGMKDFGSRLMRREVHKQLMAMVEELHKNGVKDLVVRGAPGTGKSFWLFLVMLEGARRNTKIVLQHSVLQARFLFDGCTVQEGSIHDFRRELQDPRVWYLVDGETASVASAQTFMVVSPEHSLYYKFANTGSAAIRVSELYTQWGGIPRYCLQFAENEARQDHLSAALHGTALSQLFKAVGTLETAGYVNHVILHWSVSPDLKKETVVWASDYVAREMMRRVRLEARMDLLKALGVCHGIRETAAIAEAGFEAMFHTMMQEEPIFDCHDLENPEAPEMSVAFPKARLHVFLDKKEVGTVKNADYFVPELQDFKAVDSLLLENSVFQATTAEKHPVCSTGLEDALQLLPECNSYNLFFPIPVQRFKDFTKQTYKAKEGGDLHIPGGRVKKVHQYALKVEM